MTSRLLLHICCGPCAIMPTRHLLEEGFEITGLFYNPNIHPLKEYLQRREAALICADKLGIEMIWLDEFDIGAWIREQLPRRDSPQRCEWCVEMRIRRAHYEAARLGYEYFTTSLLYSRYQPHEHIARTGKALLSGPKFIYRDFRAYWQAGINAAKEWELYRQPYCGCIFSETERYAKKFEKLKNNLKTLDVVNKK